MGKKYFWDSDLKLNSGLRFWGHLADPEIAYTAYSLYFPTKLYCEKYIKK